MLCLDMNHHLQSSVFPLSTETVLEYSGVNFDIEVMLLAVHASLPLLDELTIDEPKHHHDVRYVLPGSVDRHLSRKLSIDLPELEVSLRNPNDALTNSQLFLPNL
ncbi:unnamed protein product [Brugia timori]|uniref:Uncharacterized protein n=1 Tax=Brugia timori TaxID=42155 RepID=A0A0R3R549_9BILA|nr:unnamed protein product [Brugia timori]